MEIVVVTGAARSIGCELAISLSSEYNYHVFAGVRRREEYTKLENLDRCGNTGRGRLTPVMLDVTDGQQVIEAAEKVTLSAGSSGIKAVVNCPGLLYNDFIEFADIDQWNQAYDVQLNGNIRTFQCFASLLRESGDGRFIMMSSPMAFMGLPTMGSNALNRGATEALANVLRLELYGQPIQVSVVWPLGVRGGQVKKSEPQLLALKDRLSSDPRFKPYEKAFESFENFQDTMTWSTGQVLPTAVVPAVLDAIASSEPKSRYVVGKGPDEGLLPQAESGFIQKYLKRFWPPKTQASE